MDESIWLFARGDDRMAIARRRTATAVSLVVGRGDGARTYMFSEAAALEQFQLELEVLLLSQRWTFLEFVPDPQLVG